MPLFFFQVSSDNVPDTEGVELFDAVSARREAIRTAGRILIDSEQDILDGETWKMCVTDHKGGVICNLQILATSS